MSPLLSLRIPARRAVRFFPVPPPPEGGRPAGPSMAQAEGLVLAGRELGLRLQIAQTGTPVRLGAAREEAAFRVIREGLIAAAAHADAAEPVMLELHWSRHGLELRLTETPGETALGQLLTTGSDIAALEQHAARAGGTLRAGMSPDGFSLLACFPAPRLSLMRLQPRRLRRPALLRPAG